MRQTQRWAVSLIIALSLITGFFSPYLARAETCKAWVAQIVSVQGGVEVRKAGETDWRPVRLDERLCPDDTLHVQERSRAALVLSNETNLRLDQHTTLTFTTVAPERAPLLNLLLGTVYFFSRRPRSLQVNTPFLNAAVEGTEFLVKVASDQTFLSIFEGRVTAANEAGSLQLTGGQAAVAGGGRAPAPYLLIRPRDEVQWALYYPPILDDRSDDFQGEDAWQALVRRSIQFYQQGDLPMAFASLIAVPENVAGPRFFTYRAGLWLTVGRVEEAREDIDRALQRDPYHSYAFALQAIIAVVGNNRDKAIELARQAVKLAPTSSVAHVALSYAQQAHFDLQGALASLQRAVQLAPHNALAWARLAELWLSVRELRRAVTAAQNAVDLQPTLARTHTVLGFALLTQIKMREARDAFVKAIALEQAAPLPRLGLGLVRIRQGKLQEGRKEIEIAASLDPNNSLIRSYLGKAYHEEKRAKQARDQFAAAKALDPFDPTPWFYDAIRNQTVNRPAEALHDSQRATELNDNRAVYRSRLSLDDDLAARSATLARIYNELGFQQLALVEGWKSLNVDPGNYSAHRFLADSYAALPRHEIARVSELLQSQLLQPINITPVQPQLAESELFILSGAGPSDPSLNEFNPLFNRNRFALLASGIAGGNGTWGNEVVLSGVAGRLSYSAGQLHYETDGFRENNDLEQNIYNVFIQMSLSHTTSLQAEFRYTDFASGDLSLFFNPDIFFPTLRQTARSRSIRFGFRHGFTPRSDIIASVIYRSADFHDLFPGIVDRTSDEDAYMAEVQHLSRAERLNVISGVGHFGAKQNEVVNAMPSSEIDIRHTNVYAYAHFNVLKDLTLTLAGSADFFKDATVDRGQFNPKVGVTWNPLPRTTLRAAAFRTLKRRVVASQTIEPTQVAGFNQFFDDANGTDAWRYGVAIDQKFSAHLYVGAEWSARDLDVPTIMTRPVRRVVELDRDERLARAYVNWTPWPWLALRAEYRYEELLLDPEARNPLAAAEVKTHSVPLGFGVFHPSGFRARLQATYIKQEGKFEDVTGAIVPGNDHFWVVDASLGYRLPKRWGLVDIEIKNLFDQQFRFQDTAPETPVVSPERLILGRFTLAF